MSRRQWGTDEFEVEVSRYVVPELVKVLRKHGAEQDATDLDEAVKKFGARTSKLTIGDWSKELLAAVIPVLAEEKKASSYMKALLAIRERPKDAPVKKLEFLPAALSRYLADDAIDGWVYEEVLDGVRVAYVVKDIEYTPPDSYSGTRNPAFVTIKLSANKADFSGEDREERGNGIKDKKVYLHNDDLAGRATAAKVLLKAGLLKETKELKDEYLTHLELFQKYQPRDTEQFVCKGRIQEASNDWWSRSDKTYVLPHPTRMVQDEGVLARKITLECNNYHWREFGIKEMDTRFGRVPIHPYILFFDLTRHEHGWVHVANCAMYKYDPSLRDKLILPDNHRDLIDVLTEDMDVFVEDIISGKSGGTAILCYGAPGLGKTLTAEVYSEVVKRPLYRVHAGQLGTDVETVEAALEKVLRRAERWGAVLLLDEADVYIRQRGNDIAHNAVVAAFLRTLEYFHGLLFMTTNRIGDVDDAIASRMVATFKYETPDATQAAAIWGVLSKQFGLTLPDKYIAALVAEFPTASGRDIKQLLKLTIKYCRRKGKKLTVEAFRICAMFRGIK